MQSSPSQRDRNLTSRPGGAKTGGGEPEGFLSGGPAEVGRRDRRSPRWSGRAPVFLTGPAGTGHEEGGGVPRRPGHGEADIGCIARHRCGAGLAGPLGGALVMLTGALGLAMVMEEELMSEGSPPRGRPGGAGARRRHRRTRPARLR